MKYSFSGHESFQCKSLWLKKGYDFVRAGLSFNDESAVVELGVGKNMVSAIRYWLKAFGIITEEGKTTPIADYLFGENGKDLYLEDIGTQWLLHYLLVSSQVATIYNVLFCDYATRQRTISKSQFQDYLKRCFDDKRFGKTSYNENTIGRDIGVLLKNYVRPTNPKAIDDFSAVLLDLNLITKSTVDEYEIGGKQAKLPALLFLYAILDTTDEAVVEYSTLLSLAKVFALSQNGLNDIIMELSEKVPGVQYQNAAGEQLFTIQRPMDKWAVLDEYYSTQS